MLLVLVRTIKSTSRLLRWPSLCTWCLLNLKWNPSACDMLVSSVNFPSLTKFWFSTLGWGCFDFIAESNEDLNERSWCRDGVPQLPAAGMIKALAFKSPKTTALRGTYMQHVGHWWTRHTYLKNIYRLRLTPSNSSNSSSRLSGFINLLSTWQEGEKITKIKKCNSFRSRCHTTIRTFIWTYARVCNDFENKADRILYGIVAHLQSTHKRILQGTPY